MKEFTLKGQAALVVVGALVASVTLLTLVTFGAIQNDQTLKTQQKAYWSLQLRHEDMVERMRGQVARLQAELKAEKELTARMATGNSGKKQSVTVGR
jgi:hypothetical protein